MFFKFFGLSALFSFLVVFSHDNIRDLDIEVIAPSSGVSKSVSDKVSKIIGSDFDGVTGSSEDQVFANEMKKFQKLDKALRSNHKIIWALRGGYGMDKLMARVASSDYSRETEKIIVGYSDLTPLMIHMHQKYGWIALNAPMLKDFANGDKSTASYQTTVRFLKGQQKNLKLSDLKPLNNLAKNLEISGKVTGGNLTCIVSTIGTTWQIDTSNKIVFIEDTGVSGYHLDRLLTHMKNVGLFSNVVAIVFGDFGRDVSKVLKAFASGVKLPVFKSNSFGHQKVNLPFGYGFNGVIKSNTTTAEITMKP